MPELTVLMPVRDGAQTVGLAARSTLRALPRDAELLVLDDASTDATPRVLADLAARSPGRLRVLRTDEPLGVARGLQRLLAETDSRLVARMDADDVCLPGRFAAQARAVRATGPDRLDVVFGGVVTFRDDLRRVRPPSPVGLSRSALPLHLVLGNPLGHSTMLARTDTLRAVGGYRSVLTEDYDLWLRLAARGIPMARLARPVTAYRVHTGQVTRTAAWTARPPLEEPLVASYGDLCRQVTGREPTWWPNPRRNPQTAARLAAMAGALEAPARALGPVERRVLERKIAAARRLAVPGLGPVQVGSAPDSLN